MSITTELDKITWKWTANGQYTVRSAYDMQFARSTSTALGAVIWKAQAEPKCIFLAWLLMHGKVPTTDNLAKKNWPHNLMCPLCLFIPKRNDHLFTQCNYIEATWAKVAAHLQLPSDCTACNPHGRLIGCTQLRKEGLKQSNEGISESYSPFGGKFRKNVTGEFLKAMNNHISKSLTQ